MNSFTLIETIVTIFVFTLIIGAIFGMVFLLYRTQSYSWQQAVAIDEARRGVETMVREIREARSGDDGSFAIEKADDKEFVFYSDIDKDGDVERVRYFLGTVGSGKKVKECVSFLRGGVCDISFSDFLRGSLVSAHLKISLEGDLGWNNKEYVDLYADDNYLGRMCNKNCADCPAVWQGNSIFDVTDFAKDGLLHILAQASNRVDPMCDWQQENHSIKVRAELFWEESIEDQASELKKGVINPTGSPPIYLSEQEEISILSSYVRNSPPIFEYFDKNGNKITDYPARLKDTKLMKIFLVVNVNPNRLPQNFELESYVQLRNLKEQ